MKFIIVFTNVYIEYCIPWGLKNPVIQNFTGLPVNNQEENCLFLSNNSVNQNPREDDSHDLAFHIFGTLASYMLSRASLNSYMNLYELLLLQCILVKKITSLIIMTPSMASKRSVRMTLTNLMTTCILSISCFKKIFIEVVAPNICNLHVNTIETFISL